MSKEAKKILVQLLKEHLEESEKMWDASNPAKHAFIIGYLQGAIKGTITALEK